MDRLSDLWRDSNGLGGKSILERLNRLLTRNLQSWERFRYCSQFSFENCCRNCVCVVSMEDLEEELSSSWSLERRFWRQK
jgi:hypothetical protein